MLRKLFQKFIMLLLILSAPFPFLGYSIGSRKTAVARVRLVLGTGKMVVNCRQGEKYLQFNSQYINISKSPLKVMGLENMYDIYVLVHGGGLKGQAAAIQLGIARALCCISPETRALYK